MLRLRLSWSHATAHGVRRVHPQHISELHCTPRLLVRRLFPDALADAAARPAGRSGIGIRQLEVRSSDRALVQYVLFCRVTELENVRKEGAVDQLCPLQFGHNEFGKTTGMILRGCFRFANHLPNGTRTACMMANNHTAASHAVDRDSNCPPSLTQFVLESQAQLGAGRAAETPRFFR